MCDECEETMYYLGVATEKERLLGMKNEIINSVVDYTLTPAQYDRAVTRLEALIEGKDNA